MTSPTTLTACLALSAALLAAGPASGALAQERPTGMVAGEVVAWATQRPVAGATVSIPAEGLSTRSGPGGRFAFERPVSAERPYRRLRVVVSAPGWGTWTIDGAPLWAGDTLRLHAELRDRAVTHQVRTPQERAAADRPPADRPAAADTATAANTCTGWDYQLVPPPTIWVWLHTSGTAKQYGFNFYVRHVLPNEWISSWDADALGAGAIAAKTYAAYRAMTGHAAITGPPCADIRDDTYDQVFDPSWSTASTDQAVDVAMGSILYRDGGLFLAQYWSGSPGDPCQAVTTGAYAGRMSQWGTQTCATQGKLWPAIAQVFYTGSVWKILRNLLQNPGAEASVGVYPWVGGPQTDLQRLTGSGLAAAGNWYLTAEPNAPGQWASLHQVWPIVGTASSTYTAQAALRCPGWNSAPCSVNLRVTAIPASGSSVSTIQTVTIPRDRAWHVVTLGAPGPGKAHNQVWFNVASHQDLWVDDASLTTPYGGP